MHAASINMWYESKRSNYSVFTSAEAADEADAPLAGAAVSVTTTLPHGSHVSRTFITDREGNGTTILRSRLTGTYVSKVIGVVKDGWLYLDTGASQILDVPWP